DVLVIGSGFGGAIAAYHLAAGGAKVTVLERGPWLKNDEFEHDYKLGSSYTRIFDFVVGDGMSVLGGNCVGGGSVVYFAAMPRAPEFVFDRHGSIGRRMWPTSVSRETLDPWYDRIEESLSVSRQDWSDASYAGGLWAAACDHAGRTANPLAAAIDNSRCVNCNFMMAGCRFEAKQSLTVNYLPAAIAHGAEIRPLHEVQHLTRTPDGDYRVHYNIVHDEDYRLQNGSGVIEAKIVVMAAGAGATPVILQRSEAHLGTMPRAVGRYFSGNGERLNTAVLNEDKVAEILGLTRGGGDLPYGANAIGKGP
ncbi:GMC family oxidoreductase, partial [Streptomyces sp. PKU-MA01144]|uniref:FAD-dependent oxidoreductase n=1 Tax=Streptomyces sp. PKU-MA01144 TaxID=2729138 RepID=UPI00147A0B1D